MYGGANDNKSDGLTTMWNAQRDRLAYQYRSLSDGDGSWYSMRGNVDYQRTSKKNKDRMITLSYKISTQPQNSDYYTDYKDIKDPFEMDIVKKFLLNNSHSDGKTNTTEHTFQVDYTTPIGNCILLKPELNISSVITLVITNCSKPRASVTTTNTTTTVVASINI